MSFKTILIIIFAVSMCLGPIMLMQPNARQRREAKLRAKALELGLKVRTGRVGGKQDNKQICVYYLPWSSEQMTKKESLKNWCLIRHSFEHDLHFYRHWSADNDRNQPNFESNETIKILLDELPVGVKAVESFAAGFGVYWDESGGLETLEKINQWLRGFNKQVLGS